MRRVRKLSIGQVVEEKSSFKRTLFWWVVRAILLLIVIGFYNHHNHVEEENAALSERVQRLEKELRELKEHCVLKTTLDHSGTQRGSNEAAKFEPRNLKTRSALGEEPRLVSHSRDTGVMDIPVSSSREDVNTGIEIFTWSGESDDTLEAHVSHHGGRDTNTPRQIGDTKKDGEHATDIEAENTLSVTVGRNIIGLVGNKMYATDSTQQAGHEDYDNDPDSHVYHYADEDDINNVLQSDQGNGNVGHPNDTAVPNNSRKGASYLRHNPVYDPGALSQDNKKESTCFTFLRPYLLRGIIIVAVAVFVSVVVVTVIYLTQPLDNSKNLTMGSLRTTSSLVNMTTTPQVVTTMLPLPELNTLIHERFISHVELTVSRKSSISVLARLGHSVIKVYSRHRKFGATSVTRGMDDVTNKTSPTMRASDGCKVGYKRLASSCFRLHFRRMTWMKAKEACKKEGARLAMPKTEELDIALRNLVRTEGQNRKYWIGLKDKERKILWKKNWVWDDGDGIQGSHLEKNGTMGSDYACSTGQVPLVTPCGMIVAAMQAASSSAKHP
ncbi:hypothetical protein Bbelb_200320 [Branchiostoma belcheri]|nr:hypothetical protein Bbelb_200320 [Branchiostoma belcheri]